MNLRSIFILLFLSTSTFAFPKESINPTDIFVGDIFEYTIQFEGKLPENLLYPDGDFIQEGEQLPIFKTLSANKSENQLQLKIRFYQSGEYLLPIEWEEQNQIYKSELKIKVNSNLRGDETDIDDIEPPISFSGFYLYRLLFAFICFIVLVYLIYAMYLFWKKQVRVVDTKWEKIPEIEPRTKKLYQLEQSLIQTDLSLKEFCYMVTTYCKEEYSFRLNSNLLNLTDSEFLAYLYDHSGVEESILRELRSIFRNAKYANEETVLSREEAKSLWDDWKLKLKL
jgi:hypothetical protein